MNEFIQHLGKKITGVLTGLDRVRFRGTLRRVSSTRGLESYLKYKGILFKNFPSFSKEITEEIRQASEESKTFADRPNLYIDKPGVSKEALAKEIARKDGIESGPICILRAVEPCWSFDLRKDKVAKEINVISRLRKCLHIYHYQFHPLFGFMHSRLQTWFPFNITICINGREWLRQQLDQSGITYTKRENCFINIADINKAQLLLNKQLETNWQSVLGKIVHTSNPAHQSVFASYPLEYYWSADETEWATDIMFKKETELTALYQNLIRHGMATLGSRDVLRFLGQKVPIQGGVHGHFLGEVTTDLKQRPEGIRIKHSVKKNSLKMYNKQGSVLRVETTINHTRDFWVYRLPENAKKGQKPSPQRMRKGVADLKRRADFSNSVNERYLKSMATISSPTTLGDVVTPITKSRTWKKQKVRGINVFEPSDANLLNTVSKGELAVHGFRNRDLRSSLFTPTKDPITLKKQSAAVTRKLRLLRAHGLIAKVPRSHRYNLTDKGRLLCTTINAASHANSSELLKMAA